MRAAYLCSCFLGKPPPPYTCAHVNPSFVPDHNKVHAADVLHATSYLLFEIIPEFSCTVSSSERVWTGNQRTRMGGNIASAFSILEVFSIYMAAAVHDFDHPGRTNAFLVATKSPLVRVWVGVGVASVGGCGCGGCGCG